MSERLRDVRNLSESDLEEPRGVGGWLIVFAVLVALHLLNASYALFFSFLPSLTGPENWDLSGTEGLLNETLLAVLSWYLVIGMVVVIGLGMLSLITLLMQDRRFPSLAISYLIANAAFWVIQAISFSVVFHPMKSVYSVEWTVMSGPIVFAVIWIVYFKRSKRMRNTFGRTEAPRVNALQANTAQ